MGIRLTDDEAWDVLARSHTGILTTLRADGRPVTLPVWFVALDRTVCLVAPSRTRKIRRVRRDPGRRSWSRQGLAAHPARLTGLDGRDAPRPAVWPNPSSARG
jgi:hypothetical protein